MALWHSYLLECGKRRRRCWSRRGWCPGRCSSGTWQWPLFGSPTCHTTHVAHSQHDLVWHTVSILSSDTVSIPSSDTQSAFPRLSVSIVSSDTQSAYPRLTNSQHDLVWYTDCSCLTHSQHNLVWHTVSMISSDTQSDCSCLPHSQYTLVWHTVSTLSSDALARERHTHSHHTLLWPLMSQKAHI